MKKINCIAIDDEPIALSVISQFCLRTGGLDLLTCSEPQEGLQAVINRQPDIVFLDIEMDCLPGCTLRGTTMRIMTMSNPKPKSGK